MKLSRRLNELSNVWLSTFSGNKVKDDDYDELQNHLSPEKFPDWAGLREREWFGKAQELAGKSRPSTGNWSFRRRSRRNSGIRCGDGNLPYIREETISNDSEFYKREFNYIYEGKADIYVYFIGQSLKLTKDNGFYGIIVSNKWMRAKYGSKLRLFLKDNVRIRSILDFGELPVFNGVGTFPAIIILEKDNINPNQGFFAQIRELPDENSFSQILNDAKKIEIVTNHLSKSTWAFDNNEKLKMNERIENIAINLKDYVKRPLLVGIKTGLNSAFILDSNKVKEITKDFSTESDI